MTQDDKLVLAELKRQEIREAQKNIPKFRALSGIPSLDWCIEGFRKGQLVVVSGPPKNGKTAICTTFTKHFINQGFKCVWFSYELTYAEIFEKFPMESLDFYVPNYLASGNLNWIERKVIEATERDDIKADAIFIDNLDFLRDTEVLRGLGLNLAAYVGGIVQKLKRIAVERNVVIFLMSHIRKNKWTENELPSSEELRDSGQVAQLADIVMMIMRRKADKGSQEVYDGNRALLGVMENRHNGKTKKIDIQLFDNEFTEVAYSGVEAPQQKVVQSWR